MNSFFFHHPDCCNTPLNYFLGYLLHLFCLSSSWLCPAAGGCEDVGTVHVVQCPRRRQGHHAAHTTLRTQKCHAGTWRGHQNGLPEKENRAGIWYI